MDHRRRPVQRLVSVRRLLFALAKEKSSSSVKITASRARPARCRSGRQETSRNSAGPRPAHERRQVPRVPAQSRLSDSRAPEDARNDPVVHHGVWPGRVTPPLECAKERAVHHGAMSGCSLYAARRRFRQPSRPPTPSAPSSSRISRTPSAATTMLPDRWNPHFSSTRIDPRLCSAT